MHSSTNSTMKSNGTSEAKRNGDAAQRYLKSAVLQWALREHPEKVERLRKRAWSRVRKQNGGGQ